jgi:hypothetical protein
LVSREIKVDDVPRSLTKYTRVNRDDDQFNFISRPINLMIINNF